MSMTDPIADLLTRVRNALMIKRQSVRAPYSKIKAGVLETLLREGFIKGYETVEDGPKKDLLIYLKYADNGMKVLSVLKRVSKPGCRTYSGSEDIKPVMNGIGISIVTTPKGVLSDKECRQQKVGGEVICEVW